MLTFLTDSHDNFLKFITNAQCGCGRAQFLENIWISLHYHSTFGVLALINTISKMYKDFSNDKQVKEILIFRRNLNAEKLIMISDLRYVSLINYDSHYELLNYLQAWFWGLHVEDYSGFFRKMQFRGIHFIYRITF